MIEKQAAATKINSVARAKLAKKIVNKKIESRLIQGRKKEGYSALDLAVMNKQIHRVEYLVKHISSEEVGKQIPITGQTALHLAVNGGDSKVENKIVEILLNKMNLKDVCEEDNTYKYTALAMAMKQNNRKIVEKLLEKEVREDMIGKNDVLTPSPSEPPRRKKQSNNQRNI